MGHVSVRKKKRSIVIGFDALWGAVAQGPNPFKGYSSLIFAVGKHDFAVGNHGSSKKQETAVGKRRTN